MNVKEQYWKYSLVTIIVVLGTILFVEFIPFLGGILGACTIYILVRKQMLYLTEKKHLRRSFVDRKSTRLNSSHWKQSRMPSSA